MLFDLLTAAEEASERETRHPRFDIGVLADRLLGATRSLAHLPSLAPRESREADRGPGGYAASPHQVHSETSGGPAGRPKHRAD